MNKNSKQSFEGLVGILSQTKNININTSKIILTHKILNKINFNYSPNEFIEDTNIKKLLEISDEVELDLNSQKIIFGNESINFEIDSHRKIRLLEGLDDIDLTLKEDQKIENFEKNSSTTSIF